MRGVSGFEELRSRVSVGKVDTVLVCFVDRQGRGFLIRKCGVNGMGQRLTCISPIDGSVFAERAVLSRDESFGPVVGIMKVSSDAEAIALMNDSAFGLTASLWTADVGRAARIGDQIETGTVFLNRADYLDPGLCWTGCKNTGRGGGLSVIGYHNLTRPKSYHLKKVTG